MFKKIKKSLLKIQIKNFKSIRSVDLELKNEIKLLIGSNETGKSNILDAINKIEKNSSLNLLDQNFNVQDHNKDITEIIFETEIDQNFLNKIDFIREIVNEEKKSCPSYFFNFIRETKRINLRDKKNISCFLEDKTYFEFLVLNFFEKTFCQSFKVETNLKIFLEWFFKKNLKLSEFIISIRNDLKFGEFTHCFWKDFNLLSNFQNIFFQKNFKLQKIIIIKELQRLINLMKDLKKDYLSKQPLEIFYFKRNKFKSMYTYKDIESDVLFRGFWKTLVGNTKKIKKIQFFYKEKSKLKYEDISGNDYYDKQIKFLINDINEKINKKLKLNSFFQKKQIEFQFNATEDHIFIHSADKRKKELGPYKDLSYRSSGMINYLSLVFFLNNIEYKIEKNTLILLDEPDHNLHAQAILDLKENLSKMIEERSNLSIIIASHNPFWIDENNVHKILFIDNSSLEEGTKIIKRLEPEIGKYGDETLLPFLYKIGIDRSSFVILSESINVFVEGFVDMLLFNAVQYHFVKDLKEEKYKNLFFIPLDSASKSLTSPQVFILSALTKKIPYFIFDYDLAGLEAIQKNQEEPFPHKAGDNVFFVNLKENYLKNDANKEDCEKNKMATENLFTEEIWKKTKISALKSQKIMPYFRFALEVSDNIRANNIKITENTKRNFKKIFDKILDKQNNLNNKIKI